MNDLEKLVYLHDPRGSAKTFLLTKEEMQEFINAAIAVGQDGIAELENTLDTIYEEGYNVGYAEAEKEFAE